MNFEDLPLVKLPGIDEDYCESDSWGRELEELFPEQGGLELATACYYNDYGPAREVQIRGLRLLQEGANDGDSWIWEVKFEDRSVWKVKGWCDYTGWDCQSELIWTCLVREVEDA